MTALHLSNDAVLVLDDSLNITYASPTVTRLLGQPLADLVGQPCQAVLSCGCPTGPCPARQALSACGTPVRPLVLNVSGQTRVLMASALPLLSATGPQLTLLTLREPAATGIGAQFSSLQHVEEGLQKILGETRELLKSDFAALALYEEQIGEVRWQLANGNLSPYVTEIRLRQGQGFAGQIISSDLSVHTCQFPQDVTGDPASYPIFQAEGLRSALGVPVRVGNRTFGVLMVANRQIHTYSDTDQRVLGAVADTIALAAENLRLFQQAGLRAATAERVRLAEEIHDGMSQNLFGLHLLLADVQQSLHCGELAAAEAGLERVVRMLGSSLAEVRRLIADLRGAPALSQGFLTGLCEYIEHYSRLSGLRPDLELTVPVGESADPPAGVEILRVAQEALINVHRHARATQVKVTIKVQGDQWRLQISDNGRGFDPGTAPPIGHYGLTIMRERATRCGATLEIQSAPGYGTVVSLQITRRHTTLSV